jgi:hypothetical protein
MRTKKSDSVNNLTCSGCTGNSDDLSSTPAALSGLLHCGVKCRAMKCPLCVWKMWNVHVLGVYLEAFVCVAENDFCCAAFSEILHFFRLWSLGLCCHIVW